MQDVHGVFTIPLPIAAQKRPRVCRRKAGSAAGHTKGQGFSSGDVVRVAWWMDSQVPLIRSRADEIIRKARQREMIRKIEAGARKNGGSSAYRDAEEDILTI